MSNPPAVFDPLRLQAVAGSSSLDTPTREAFARLTTMAGALLDAPFALVTLIDANRSFWNCGAGEQLIVGDLHADPRTQNSPSIEAFGVAAWAGYPVFGSRGDVLGTFCVIDTRVREWTERDELVLETLSESASREIALRTAIDAEREARAAADDLARSLQATLLPPHVPTVAGVDLAARFAPAGRGTDVVGDFYDVFPIGDKCWGLAIGDVCGKGIQAARVTALARYTLRAAAMSETEPSRVLDILNSALLGQDDSDGRFLSAWFGVLGPTDDAVELSMSSAGHPPPLLRRADRSVVEVPVRGTLMGCVAEPVLRDTSLVLAPGEMLLLYTDGVTEARAGRGTELLGEERLHALLAAAPDDVEGAADHIEAAVAAHSGGTLADDMALLVLGAARA